MSNLSEFVSEPFTNEAGQVINPGDKVAFVSVGIYSKKPKVHTGIYRGYHKYPKSGYYSREKSVSVSEVPYKVWDRNQKKHVDGYRTATLQNNFVFKL